MISFCSKFFSKLCKKSSYISDSSCIGIVFTEDGKVLFSKSNTDFIPLVEEFNGLGLDIDLVKKTIVENSFKSDKKNQFALNRVVLAHWKCCFLNCVYCKDTKTDDLLTVNHFDIMPVIEQLVDSGVITKDTKIIFLEDDINKNCKDKFIEYRNKANQNLCHGRIPEIVASEYMGIELFLEFARKNEVITNEKMLELKNISWNCLMSAAQKQSMKTEENRTDNMFFRAVQELYVSKEINILL